MRSTTGASAALLMRARKGKVTLLANVALALEYEAACRRAEHAVAAGLTAGEVGIFVDAVLAMVEPVESYFMWRPLLRDPADEMVVEAAVNGILELFRCPGMRADPDALVEGRTVMHLRAQRSFTGWICRQDPCPRKRQDPCPRKIGVTLILRVNRGGLG